MYDGYTGNSQGIQKSWIFVVDTNQYSGNFERELTAYMKGMIGGCGVGVELA